MNDFINTLLYALITVIVPIISGYVVSLIKAKIDETRIIEESTQNEVVSRIVKDTLKEVADAVAYVNQTYVDSIKASGSFNKEAQKKAYNLAYAKALETISETSKDIINEFYGSFEVWLGTKIEVAVKTAKEDNK